MGGPNIMIILPFKSGDMNTCVADELMMPAACRAVIKIRVMDDVINVAHISVEFS